MSTRRFVITALPALAALSATRRADASVTQGVFSEVFPWPAVAIHVTLLPSGDLLSWQDADGNVGKPQGQYTKAHLIRVSPGSIPTSQAWVPMPHATANLFCAGQTTLPDGNVLVVGGQTGNYYFGVNRSVIFDVNALQWTSPPDAAMNYPRWYPSLLTLPNGETLALGGSMTGQGTAAVEPEIWQTGGGWRRLDAAKRKCWTYSWLVVHPQTGRVLVAGPANTAYLNTSGRGKWSAAPARTYPLRQAGSFAMFAPGQVLAVGGGDLSTNRTAERIDLTRPVASQVWVETGSMQSGRRYHTATALPDGTVLVTGGGLTQADASTAVLSAELWNPATGAWSTMASMAVPRLYHSIALLLPSGEVLVAGGGRKGGGSDRLNAQLYRPPYLFKGPQPRITAMPASVGYGQSFELLTPDAASIARISMIRLGAITHQVNMSQSFAVPTFVRSAGALTVTAPSSRFVAPPGYYMLFILDGNGVPSVAKIVQIA